MDPFFANPSMITSGDGWTEHVSKEGRKYYYNTLTQESQWGKPLSLQTPEEAQILLKTGWQEFSSADGKSYWFHSATKRSVWSTPKEVEEMLKSLQEEREDWPQFKSKDEAKTFLVKLFELKKFPPRISWENASKILESDRRWSCFSILTRGERKQTFAEYMGSRGKRAAEEERQKRKRVSSNCGTAYEALQLHRAAVHPSSRARACIRLRVSLPAYRCYGVQYICMHALISSEGAKDLMVKNLLEWKELSFKTTYIDVADRFHFEEWWTWMQESERDEFFQEWMFDNEQMFKNKVKERRRADVAMLEEILEQNPTEYPFQKKWSEVRDQLLSHPKLQNMMKIDVLQVWEEWVRHGYDQERKQRQAQNFRRQRKRRDAFRELLQDAVDKGEVSSRTEWASFVRRIEKDPRYTAMVGQGGSTPRELFCDAVERLREQHEQLKQILKRSAERAGLDIRDPALSFNQFYEAVRGQEDVKNLNVLNTKMVFEALRQSEGKSMRVTENAAKGSVIECLLKEMIRGHGKTTEVTMIAARVGLGMRAGMEMLIRCAKGAMLKMIRKLTTGGSRQSSVICWHAAFVNEMQRTEHQLFSVSVDGLRSFDPRAKSGCTWLYSERNRRIPKKAHPGSDVGEKIIFYSLDFSLLSTPAPPFALLDQYSSVSAFLPPRSLQRRFSLSLGVEPARLPEERDLFEAPEGAVLHSGSESEAASNSEGEGVEVKQLRMRQVLAADRRLHRLAAAAAAQGERRRREAFVIQSEKERQRLEKGIVESEGDEGLPEDEWGGAGTGVAAEETGVKDRAQLRAAALERRRREERLLQQQQQQDEETEESEESDYSEASDDQPDETNVILHKPTFVPKANRLTVHEREEQQRREKEEQMRQQHEEEQRKLETKHMVYAALAREDEAAADAPVTAVEQQPQQHQQEAEPGDEMPDDTDGLDAAQEVPFYSYFLQLSLLHASLLSLLASSLSYQNIRHSLRGERHSVQSGFSVVSGVLAPMRFLCAQYEDWKLRELERIRRDKDELLEREKFLEAVERRRLMTAEERREDDKELDKMQPKREIRHKYHFMQKYYHRGAFFQDLARSGEEPLYLRDFNAPVGEDAVDKKALPKILQLRRGELARGGRTKHTHLVDVDTSDLSHPWVQATRDLHGQKLLKKAGGLKGSHDFERPSLRKPKQDG
ncbi:formin binding [Cyclospora cayetanensis]|uniref:Formin binding n=1 Tax=Cyclospora cayetanensis TaxID=88456 RepID=A0A1D3D723_9EIME|nr:formin binding [Cyclospora cayetanensis]